jgi:hypothetical protein
MPIEYEIDHDRRLVRARGVGKLTDQDIFEYQRTVWGRADIAGYGELIDMSDVTTIALPSVDRVQDLATLSASMDHSGDKSKLAIVAPEDLAFGLGRMYQVHRHADGRSTKEVGVFRSVGGALAFLGLDV